MRVSCPACASHPQCSYPHDTGALLLSTLGHLPRLPTGHVPHRARSPPGTFRRSHTGTTVPPHRCPPSHRQVPLLDPPPPPAGLARRASAAAAAECAPVASPRATAAAGPLLNLQDASDSEEDDSAQQKRPGKQKRPRQPEPSTQPASRPLKVPVGRPLAAAAARPATVRGACTAAAAAAAGSRASGERSTRHRFPRPLPGALCLFGCDTARGRVCTSAWSALPETSAERSAACRIAR